MPDTFHFADTGCHADILMLIDAAIKIFILLLAFFSFLIFDIDCLSWCWCHFLFHAITFMLLDFYHFSFILIIWYFYISSFIDIWYFSSAFLSSLHFLSLLFLLSFSFRLRLSLFAMIFHYCFLSFFHIFFLSLIADFRCWCRRFHWFIAVIRRQLPLSSISFLRYFDILLMLSLISFRHCFDISRYDVPAFRFSLIFLWYCRCWLLMLRFLVT